MAEVIVRRVGVFSIAKIQGLLMFIIGLIIGVLYGLTVMIFGAAIVASMQRGGGSANPALGGVSTIVAGLVIMIAFPIFYGIMGFIGGAIGGLVYNIAAGVVGGIKLELETNTPQYAPPPPQQWS
jgi:hypothetical protein